MPKYGIGQMVRCIAKSRYTALGDIIPCPIYNKIGTITKIIGNRPSRKNGKLICFYITSMDITCISEDGLIPINPDINEISDISFEEIMQDIKRVPVMVEK